MVATPTEAFLRSAYVAQGLSTWAIEKKYGIPRSTVHSSLRRYGIQARTISQSHVRYPRSDFSGDLKEKAYLLGFSIGDLRVRRHNGNKSETISVGCGSTKPAQIKLIRGLFSQYGRVWESAPDKRGAVNIEAFVPMTFSFLLPNGRDYRWCVDDKNHFFSFLAGFTDAEGSFYLSRGKAFVAWGNYDAELLQFIQESLSRYGIETPRIYHDSLKGYIGSHGYVRKKNYYHLSSCKKEVVRAMLKELAPLVRHEDKKKRLALLQANLKMRS